MTPDDTSAGQGGRTALLAGATGLIGAQLLPLLRADRRYARLHLLLRRPLPAAADDARITTRIVDFAALASAALPPTDDVYLALGTTIKIAGSEADFRRIDFDAVVDTARAARAAGASRLAVVSALGADANSRVFYNRVKGEMEAAIGRLGYASVVIAQPSLLLGDRAALGQPTRRLEQLAAGLLRPLTGLLPRGMRPIPARAVAVSMIEALRDPAPGVCRLSSAQMQVAA